MSLTYAVVIPTYNGKQYLEETFQSVLSQTLPPSEVWVGDDLSNDGTSDWLRKNTPAEFKLLLHPQRFHLFGNLNYLISKCTADLIRVLCQDDLLLPECLRMEELFFRENPSVGFVYCASNSLDIHGKSTPPRERAELPNVLSPQLAVQQFFYHGCIPGNLTNAAFRRNLFERNGGFNCRLKVSGDYELWSRFATQASLGIIHTPLVAVREHPNRLSAQTESMALFVEENQRIREHLRPFLPSQVRKQVVRFEKMRHSVLDWHTSIRCLWAKNFKGAFRIWRVWGFFGTLNAILYWVWTLNNRRFRPQAPWVLDSNATL